MCVMSVCNTNKMLKDISKFKEGQTVSTLLGQEYLIVKHIYGLIGRKRKGIHSLCKDLYTGREVIITWNKSFGFKLVK